MEKVVKIPYQGSTVDGTEMDFKAVREEWNEYQTNDGSTIRMKVVVTNIVKLKDKIDSSGNPIYVVRSSNVLAVSPFAKSTQGTVS